MDNSENLEYGKYTHNFRHSLCKCKYNEISGYTNLNFGDKEKGMIDFQATTAQWAGGPGGGAYTALGWMCPILASPSPPVQGTAGWENAFKEMQRNAAEEEGKTCEKWPCRQQGQTRVRGMGCPKCQNRDSAAAPAETIAEQRGFPAGIEAQGKSRSGLTWRTPATGVPMQGERAHLGTPLEQVKREERSRKGIFYR